MESLEGKLGRIITEMSPQALRQYREKSQAGMAVETLVAIAESIARETVDDIARRGKPIRRNNGPAAHMSESDLRAVELRESQVEAFKAMGFSESIAKDMAGIAEGAAIAESEGLSESQRQDFEFCRLSGMSEADAIKVVKSPGSIRG